MLPSAMTHFFAEELNGILKFDNLKIADNDNNTVTINGSLKFQCTKI